MNMTEGGCSGEWPVHRRWRRHVQVNGLYIGDRLVQMVQLNTCTSQLETPRVQEHARTQDLATAKSGGDRSWSRAQTAGVRWHMRGGSAVHARLCARPMARSRMSLSALPTRGRHAGGWWIEKGVRTKKTDQSGQVCETGRTIVWLPTMAVPWTTRAPRALPLWEATLWSKILSMRGGGEAGSKKLEKWHDGRLLRHLGSSCGLRARLLRCLVDSPKQQRSATHTYGPTLGQQ